MPRGMIWEIVAGSFGIAAAILLVGGWILVRLARDRQQFRLLQTALEKGITSMPGLMPGWLVSLRQGVLAFVLGIGVAISGLVLNAAADHIDGLPSNALIQQQDDQPQADQLPPRGGPQQGGPGMRNQQDFPGRPGGPGQDHNGPPEQRPPQNPAMERWHRIQTQRLIGGLAGFAGVILALLGIVRIAFSRIERKYAMEITGSSTTPTSK